MELLDPGPPTAVRRSHRHATCLTGGVRALVLGMTARVLVLPGSAGSGPDHWQTRWERVHGYARVEQESWERPTLAGWKARLADAVDRAPGPVLLVAHSLGCALVAHCAHDAIAPRIAGALLVAPPDVD